MVTTNKDIIEQYKKTHNIPPDTRLYMYSQWKKMGYKLKKGESCKHRIKIKMCLNGKFIHKEKSFFELGQMERTVL